jgi:hypothetical protein
MRQLEPRLALNGFRKTGFLSSGNSLFSLLFNRINPKKGRICLPIQRKAVLLQADYYHKMIRD